MQWDKTQINTKKIECREVRTIICISKQDGLGSNISLVNNGRNIIKYVVCNHQINKDTFLKKLLDK